MVRLHFEAAWAVDGERSLGGRACLYWQLIAGPTDMCMDLIVGIARHAQDHGLPHPYVDLLSARDGLSVRDGDLDSECVVGIQRWGARGNRCWRLGGCGGGAGAGDRRRARVRLRFGPTRTAAQQQAEGDSPADQCTRGPTSAFAHPFQPFSARRLSSLRAATTYCRDSPILYEAGGSQVPQPAFAIRDEQSAG